MIITLIFWIIGVFTIVLQTTFLQSCPEWFGRPDFLFILIVFFAYRFAWIPGIVLVFSLSWIMDVVMSINLGFYPLICLLVFTALKMVSNQNSVKESTYQIPLLGVSYLASQFLLYVIYSMALDLVLPDWDWGRSVQESVLLMIVAIPVLVLVGRLHFYLLVRKQRARTPHRSSWRMRRSS